MYPDLRAFIEKLEEQGELVRVRERLSPKFEIPGVVKYLVREKNVALFFENVEGYSVPIVANLLGTKGRLATAFGVPESDIHETFRRRSEKWLKPVFIKDAPAKEVAITSNIDIVKAIPILTHHANDASPYFTSAITIAKDPDTGIRGMGIHRIEVKDKNTVAIFLATPPLSNFLARSEAKGEPLEIAIVIGVDPVTFFASAAPGVEIDKLEIAGGLRERPVEVAKCSMIDVDVPAYSEFVLEGKTIPGERQSEGPFGESTGYYFTNRSPIAKIDAITHRRDAVYQALVPFSGEDMVLLDFGWEIKHLPDIQKVYPFVTKLHFTNMLLIATVQIKKTSEEDSRKIIEELWSNPFIKIVIVVDEDVDPYDNDDVNWAIATRVQPKRDIVIKGEMPGLPIDPSGEKEEMPKECSIISTKTSKLGIDATKPLGDFERYERTDVHDDVKNKIRSVLEKYLGTFQKMA